jgi:hypothetical protein
MSSCASIVPFAQILHRKKLPRVPNSTGLSHGHISAKSPSLPAARQMSLTGTVPAGCMHHSTTQAQQTLRLARAAPEACARRAMRAPYAWSCSLPHTVGRPAAPQRGGSSARARAQAPLAGDVPETARARGAMGPRSGTLTAVAPAPSRASCAAGPPSAWDRPLLPQRGRGSRSGGRLQYEGKSRMSGRAE